MPERVSTGDSQEADGRRWTLCRVVMPSGAVGEWQVEHDGFPPSSMFDYERVAVAPVSVVEELRLLTLTRTEAEAMVGNWEHFEDWATYKAVLGQVLTNLRAALASSPPAASPQPGGRE